MDFVLDVLRTVRMIGFVAVAILALAALFMIVFGLATGMDRRMSE
ncbi:MAG TPA: hypothetical protein VM450_16495 [Thermomicrobiales bacterium]|nr:hypothetical protein [Thermomicrobiales bacterium]